MAFRDAAAGRAPVLWLRHQWGAHHYEHEQLLAITHSEVDRALLSRDANADAEREFHARDPRARALGDELAVLGGRPQGSPLRELVATFALTPMETALLALALAAATDASLARVFGYLLDSAEAADPTPSLAAALFELGDATPPGADSAILRWRLAEPVASSGRHGLAAATGWRVDPLLLRARGGGNWSAGTAGVVAQPPARPVLQPELVDAVVAFVTSVQPAPGTGPAVEIELIGPPGSGRTTVAAHAAVRLARRLLAVDLAAHGMADEAAVVREARRARLEDAGPVWRHLDAAEPAVRAAIPDSPLAFTTVLEAQRDALGPGAVRRSFRCPELGRRERIALWSSLTSEPAPAPVVEWTLRPAEIELAARVAPAGEAAVSAVCRRLMTAGTPDLLSPLPLPFGWSDLVLAPATEIHLRELEAQARNRGEVLDDWGFGRLTPLARGTSALFAGPSGTGKTMAAQVLARSLGLELYRADLAGVVNKYIGETEKHLRKLFDMCERAPALLLFDEADALFGKRSQVSDAHDRYANIQIDYLLQRMEQFDGLAILTTNRREDLDRAFVRRLRFIIEFAPPTMRERERLWRLALQDARDVRGRPLVGELNWAGLARELDLTGAGIKAAAVAAAFLARSEGVPIAERHVLAAARRELEKQGVVGAARPAGAAMSAGEVVRIERLQLLAAGLDEGAARALARLVAEGLAAGVLPLTGAARLERLRIEVPAGGRSADGGGAGGSAELEALAERIVQAIARGLDGDRLVSGPTSEVLVP